MQCICGVERCSLGRQLLTTTLSAARDTQTSWVLGSPCGCSLQPTAELALSQPSRGKQADAAGGPLPTWRQWIPPPWRLAQQHSLIYVEVPYCGYDSQARDTGQQQLSSSIWGVCTKAPLYVARTAALRERSAAGLKSCTRTAAKLPGALPWPVCKTVLWG